MPNNEKEAKPNEFDSRVVLENTDVTFSKSRARTMVQAFMKAIHQRNEGFNKFRICISFIDGDDCVSLCNSTHTLTLDQNEPVEVFGCRVMKAITEVLRDVLLTSRHAKGDTINARITVLTSENCTFKAKDLLLALCDPQTLKNKEVDAEQLKEDVGMIYDTRMSFDFGEDLCVGGGPHCTESMHSSANVGSIIQSFALNSLFGLGLVLVVIRLKDLYRKL